MSELKMAAPPAVETSPRCGTLSMERALRGIAGAFVLAGILLTTFHHVHWVYFTAFVGLNLVQSSFTNWCPMMWLLEKLGLRRTPVGS